MKILNMVIPILMYYWHFPFKKTVKMYFVVPIHPAAASCIKPLASCIYSLVNQWKATLRNDVPVCDSISQDILSQIYDIVLSDVALHLQVHWYSLQKSIYPLCITQQEHSNTLWNHVENHWRSLANRYAELTWLIHKGCMRNCSCFFEIKDLPKYKFAVTSFNCFTLH